jgi:membrane-associated phospholipid phosphatase
VFSPQTAVDDPPTLRRPAAATPRGPLLELGAGTLLLMGAALAGLFFVRRPWPNRLDVWGFGVLPANFNSRWAHDFVGLGSMTALLVGVLVVFLVGILRDRIRAVACAVAPIVAVLIVQDIAKPLVARHNGLSGALSYPSGTVAAVAALATAFTLVMPLRTRVPVALLGCAAIVGTCAAVVVLRWHYPTDALGGAAVGVGSVLVADALAQAARVLFGRLRRRPVAGVSVVGHAQVRHHGHPGQRERDPGHVVGR